MRNCEYSERVNVLPVIPRIVTDSPAVIGQWWCRRYVGLPRCSSPDDGSGRECYIGCLYRKVLRAIFGLIDRGILGEKKVVSVVAVDVENDARLASTVVTAGVLPPHT